MSHPARSSAASPDYDGHFIMIALNKGKFAIFAEADAPLILNGNGKRWTAREGIRTWYAGQGSGCMMHRLIAGYSGVDHINRNGLDNRRINLRPATTAQNAANRPPLSNNTSGYKGVSWNTAVRKWVAGIVVQGRRRHLGCFVDPADAARAYNRAASEAFGEYAWLNPVGDDV